MENVIVTIARQYGSGGKTIGEMYAKDQGINCYSREILRMASDDSGINEMLFNQADERLKGTTLFGWAKKVYKGDLIPPESDDFVSDKNLFNYQAKVIKQLAEQESCVLVGRCAMVRMSASCFSSSSRLNPGMERKVFFSFIFFSFFDRFIPIRNILPSLAEKVYT